MTLLRARLLVAAVLFAGWLAYLGYAAATKSRGPVVSRAQLAAASAAVVASVDAAPDGKRTAAVVEPLTAASPAAGATLDVANLSQTAGYVGPGSYLLLLAKDGSGYRVVGVPRSPGHEAPAGDPPIYPWSADVRGQVVPLLP